MPTVQSTPVNSGALNHDSVLQNRVAIQFTFIDANGNIIIKEVTAVIGHVFSLPLMPDSFTKNVPYAI